MVHVTREAPDDIRGGVIRERGCSGPGIEDVQDVVHGFDHVAIAGAHALIRWLDRELVPPARVALLVEVQARETKVELWVGLRLLAARR